MSASISLTISVLALFISALTGWLTLLRRGTVLMTWPTVIYFGPDGGSEKGTRPGLKIYLRTLLYATSRRGRIVEGMYVRVRRRETIQNFNVWVYGEQNLHRGSGLFVPENGFSSNHHFLLPEDGTEFRFLAGEYLIDVHAFHRRRAVTTFVKLNHPYGDAGASFSAAIAEPGALLRLGSRNWSIPLPSETDTDGTMKK